jgi:hypothetical protein
MISRADGRERFREEVVGRFAVGRREARGDDVVIHSVIV